MWCWCWGGLSGVESRRRISLLIAEAEVIDSKMVTVERDGMMQKNRAGVAGRSCMVTPSNRGLVWFGSLMDAAWHKELCHAEEVYRSADGRGVRVTSGCSLELEVEGDESVK